MTVDQIQRTRTPRSKKTSRLSSGPEVSFRELHVQVLDKAPIHVVLAGTRIANACKPAARRELIDRLFALPHLQSLQLDLRKKCVRLQFSSSAASVKEVLASIAGSMQADAPETRPLLHEERVFGGKSRRGIEIRRLNSSLTFWKIESPSPRVFFLKHPLLRSDLIRQAAMAELETFRDAVQRVIPVGETLTVLVRPFRIEAATFPEILDPVLSRTYPEASDSGDLRTQDALANASLAIAPISDFLFPPAGLANAALTGVLTQKSLPLAWAELRAGKFSLQSLNVLIVGLTIFAYEFLPMAIMYWLGRFWDRRTQALCDFQERRFLSKYRYQPHRIWIEKDGVSLETSLDAITPTNAITLNAGDIIPGDGVVVEGTATVDEYLISGDLGVVEKSRGSRLFAATRVVGGKIRMNVALVGPETASGRLVEKFRHLLQTRKSEFYSPSRVRAERAVLPTVLASGAAFLSGGLNGARSALRPDFLTGAAMAEKLTGLSAVIRAAQEGVILGLDSAMATLQGADYFVFDDSVKWNERSESRAAFRNAPFGGGKAVLFTSLEGAEASALAGRLGFQNYQPGSTREDKIRFLEEVRVNGQVAVYIGDSLTEAEAALAAALYVAVIPPPFIGLSDVPVALLSPDLSKFALLLRIVVEIQQESQTAFQMTWLPNVAAILAAIFLRSPVMASVVLTNLGMFANYVRSGTILQLATVEKQRQP